MPSAKPRTISIEISWNNIQVAIEQFLRATGKIHDSQELISLKFDYQGGYLAQDKVIRGEAIVKDEEVQIYKG